MVRQGEIIQGEITISILDYRQTKFEDRVEVLEQKMDERLTKIEKMLQN